jgi:ubiquinone/menaquinone biosynthesis C-methylase UbiE
VSGKNRYELEEAAVAAYERQKVRSIFRPLAEATLTALGNRRLGAVLDVACGTGIMARVIRERNGPAVPVVGVDVSSGMIAAARALSSDLDGTFDWHVASVDAMPLAAGSVDSCFCQQGIQYFPDEGAALAEIRRVLRDKGCLVLTVWTEANAYFRAQSDAMRRHVGEAAAMKALSPFSYPARTRLPDMLEGQGFRDVGVRDISISRVIADAERGIAEDIDGSPLGPLVRACDEATMRRVVDDILSDCADFIDGTDLCVPQHASMVTAIAGRSRSSGPCKASG